MTFDEKEGSPPEWSVYTFDEKEGSPPEWSVYTNREFSETSDRSSLVLVVLSDL